MRNWIKLWLWAIKGNQVKFSTFVSCKASQRADYEQWQVLRVACWSKHGQGWSPELKILSTSLFLISHFSILHFSQLFKCLHILARLITWVEILFNFIIFHFHFSFNFRFYTVFCFLTFTFFLLFFLYNLSWRHWHWKSWWADLSWFITNRYHYCPHFHFSFPLSLLWYKLYHLIPNLYIHVTPVPGCLWEVGGCQGLSKTIFFWLSVSLSLSRQGPYLILVIFSPRAQFLAEFFSMQKRQNRYRDKTA